MMLKKKTPWNQKAEVSCKTVAKCHGKAAPFISWMLASSNWIRQFSHSVRLQYKLMNKATDLLLQKTETNLNLFLHPTKIHQFGVFTFSKHPNAQTQRQEQYKGEKNSIQEIMHCKLNTDPLLY